MNVNEFNGLSMNLLKSVFEHLVLNIFFVILIHFSMDHFEQCCIVPWHERRRRSEAASGK